jgi:hypothetical protein
VTYPLRSNTTLGGIHFRRGDAAGTVVLPWTQNTPTQRAPLLGRQTSRTFIPAFTVRPVRAARRRSTSRSVGIEALAEAVGLDDRVRQLKRLNSRRIAGARPLSTQSMRHALLFVARQAGWPKPSVVLTPDGNVQAYWHYRDGRVVVQFLPDGRVWYVVTGPANTTRQTGLVSISEFDAAASAYANQLKR